MGQVPLFFSNWQEVCARPVSGEGPSRFSGREATLDDSGDANGLTT